MSEKINFKVIDNFLSKEDFDIIKNTIYSKHFPWFYFPNITWADKNSKNNLFYMEHVIYHKNVPNSSFYPVIEKHLLKHIKINSLIRVKCNFYPNQNIKEINEMHTDFEFSHKGAIFSINTNNGGTLLKDGTKVDSIENRILFFDPSISHDSENCTDQKARINININYF